MVCYVIFWSGQACETDRKVMWVAVNPLLHGYQSLSMVLSFTNIYLCRLMTEEYRFMAAKLKIFLMKFPVFLRGLVV